MKYPLNGQTIWPKKGLGKRRQIYEMLRIAATLLYYEISFNSLIATGGMQYGGPTFSRFTGQDSDCRWLYL
ncbi:hypothetical protein Z949_3174 [Sulfitobacter guttiformis KCTC 32187]|nr:hypothetical protein Z949_3174 [Sulfitobacter guttiformis KCTC 32187]